MQEASAEASCDASSYYSVVGMCRYMDCSASLPGPVNRFQNICPEPPNIPVESFWKIVSIRHRAVLVDPSARSNVDLLTRPEFHHKDVAVAVQPQHAVVVLAGERVDEEARPAE